MIIPISVVKHRYGIGINCYSIFKKVNPRVNEFHFDGFKPVSLWVSL